MTRRRRALRLSLVAAALAAGSACGKKGPPLAPLRRAPAQITDFTARRAGGAVRLSFTPPAANDDGSQPVDLARVDVYALTVAKPAEAPEGPPFLTNATVVATVEKPAAGERATVEEKIDAGGAGPLRSGEQAEAPAPVRIYIAVPVSGRGRRGAPSARAVVSLAAAPAPPGGLRADYDAQAITLDWLPATVEPNRETEAPGHASIYNVYEVEKGVASAKPLNDAPLKGTTYLDGRLTFGVERCYIVRAARTVDGAGVESESSAAACVTPRDTFPPAAPAGLATVASAGAINLIWDANAEPDLAGYLVLRADAPGEKLQALTPAPIRETTYRDETVTPGVRYVYAIVAVDKESPPNVSPQSARVEETAR